MIKLCASVHIQVNKCLSNAAFASIILFVYEIFMRYIWDIYMRYVWMLNSPSTDVLTIRVGTSTYAQFDMQRVNIAWYVI